MKFFYELIKLHFVISLMHTIDLGKKGYLISFYLFILLFCWYLIVLLLFDISSIFYSCEVDWKSISMQLVALEIEQVDKLRSLKMM